MRTSWVVLTQGTRPSECRRALASIRGHDPGGQLVVVFNGAPIDHEFAVDRVVGSPENVGVTGGRNLGWRASDGDVVCFLDDDATLTDSFDIDHLKRIFQGEPRLGVVSFRIVDPSTGETARRHVPRLRTGDVGSPSEVTHFLGGACAIRRSVLEELDGYEDSLFYSHEETELSWRVIDRRYVIRYEPALSVHHPAADPRYRHPKATYYSMRNRLMIARHDLPFPVGPIYVLVWTLATALRARSIEEVRSLVDGWRDGFNAQIPNKDRIRWSTVWRLTRLGRPPIV